MKLPPLLSIAVLALAARGAVAATPTNFIDHSNANLIDATSVKAVMESAIPARVWAIHPASRFVFSSQVEGGLKNGTTCVVAARVMLLPLTAAAKAVLFRPLKMATAYDALPNATLEQCRALARDKLKEAAGAVVSAIVKT